MSRSIVLIGGPDSGKTNYIGRLWPALDSGAHALHAAVQPEDISFVLEVADHLFQGHFAPRSEQTEARRDFKVVVAETQGGPQTNIIVPDISGELWREAVLNSEIAVDWMDELTNADGALLFLRIGSDQEVRPLDWVASSKMLERLGEKDENQGLPTQVMLCELLRFLEVSLKARPDGGRPRVSVVVTAWDLMDSEKFAKGPEAYIEREYPLLAGRLRDLGGRDGLDVRVFGLSIVGGDLKNDSAYRAAYLDKGLDGHGWVTFPGDDGTWQKVYDLTLPVQWVVGL